MKWPTAHTAGSRLIIDQCHCCDYYQDLEETLPPRRNSASRGEGSSHSTGSRGVGLFGGGFGGGGSSGGGFGGGSSGGGFGGGSSGGGGAGGNW
ncbi:MAG: hypothetical protein WBM32_22130 [Crocosphaera sp.]